MRAKHCLFAGTIFQDNKLPLYKLLLGLFLFFVSNKGISAIELRSHLDVNYKTALLLARKCRILMSDSNSTKRLDSLFYESDTAYIGSKAKEPGHRSGMGFRRQEFLQDGPLFHRCSGRFHTAGKYCCCQ